MIKMYKLEDTGDQRATALEDAKGVVADYKDVWCVEIPLYSGRIGGFSDAYYFVKEENAKSFFDDKNVRAGKCSCPEFNGEKHHIVTCPLELYRR